jgi:hypothetical protein
MRPELRRVCESIRFEMPSLKNGASSPTGTSIDINGECQHAIGEETPAKKGGRA